MTYQGPRVVGLDVSLTGTGIADTHGWTTTIGDKDITTLPLVERSRALDTLAAHILLEIGSPDLVVIEAPALSRSGGGAHERAGLWWKLVNRVCAWELTDIAEVTPNLRIMYALGKGTGTKGAVIDAVARRWPQYETGGDDNIADAVVLAAMGADHLGHPLAPVPQTHRRALDKVAWPEAVSS